MTNAELWYLLGILSFLSGDMKRASEVFLEVIHMNQANSSVWYIKGWVEYLSSRYKAEDIKKHSTASIRWAGSAVTEDAVQQR